MVKILGISGSPRNAATEYVLKEALKAANSVQGVSTEFLSLRGKKLNFCIHCDRCIKENVDRCLLYKDDMIDLYPIFYGADGYIIASPVYGMNISGQLATFFNRLRPTYSIYKKDPEYFSKKVGAAIAVGGARNGGQEITINSILGFYHTLGMMVVSGGIGVYGGGSVWSKDQKAQGAKNDYLGIENVRTIGIKLANAAKLLAPCSFT